MNTSGIPAFSPRTMSRRFDNPLLHIAWSYLSAAHLPIPFWFIPVIFILQLLAPVLLAVDRRPRLYWIIPPLTASAMLCHRPLDLTHIWHAFFYFAPAYLAGMWCSRYRESIIAGIARWRLPLWGLAAALVAVEVFVLGRGGAIFSREPFFHGSGDSGFESSAEAPGFISACRDSPPL